MQRGRFYPQVIPYALGANFAPHFRTPLWIEPQFNVEYGGVQMFFVPGVQNKPPLIDLKNGRVVWHGTVSQGLLDAVWDIEMLMRNGTTAMQFTSFLRDGVGGFSLTAQFWDIDQEDWRILFTLQPAVVGPYQFGSPFGFTELWLMRAMSYHEIPP